MWGFSFSLMLIVQLLIVAIIGQVYVYIFATAVLLLGGALGCYGKLVVFFFVSAVYWDYFLLKFFVHYLHVFCKQDNVRKYLIHLRIIDCIVCDALDQDIFLINGETTRSMYFVFLFFINIVSVFLNEKKILKNSCWGHEGWHDCHGAN